MKVITDYEGSSIDLIDNDEQLNKVELSLKKEKEKYSHYYNFIVENEKKECGVIYIKNIKNSAYYSKNSSYLPYIRKTGEQWQRISKEYFKVENEQIQIKVQPEEKMEISLVPRYTNKDLNGFIEMIKSSEKIKVENNILTKIELGDKYKPTVFVIGRQHPGETLSSFFIEGMIKAVLDNNELINRFHYVFYPIVNTIGVENGNHRYTNGIDYNRGWENKDNPKEIKFLKEEMKKYNIEYFIDVHNDEITTKDYLRINKKIDIKEIANIQVLETMSGIRRFIRALLKERKIINIREKTAREYVEKTYKCKSILIELSMNEDYKKIEEKGYNFVAELIGGDMNEE